jgi:hypothetical protein
VTDAVLCATTFYVVLRSTHSPLFRGAAALFSIAAFLGVLRFSGLYVNEAPHMFVSMIAGVAAFPALATSVMFPQSPITRQWRGSWLLLLIIAAVGALIVMNSGSRLYLNGCALLAVAGITYVSLRQRRWIRVSSATIMLIGLLCFALKFSPTTALQPADVLHLALAAGWLGLDRS